MLSISTRQMEKMMAQLGIKAENIDADEVIIKTKSSVIRIKEPQVTKMIIQGGETYQIVGKSEIENIENKEEDIKIIMEQTGASREAAERALNETNDIAEAILKLKNRKE